MLQGLLREVVNPALEKDNIKAVYEGVEGDYNATLLNALSAGTAGDLFYVDVFQSEPIFASGKVEPLNKYFTEMTPGCPGSSDRGGRGSRSESAAHRAD